MNKYIVLLLNIIICGSLKSQTCEVLNIIDTMSVSGVVRGAPLKIDDNSAFELLHKSILIKKMSKGWIVFFPDDDIFPIGKNRIWNSLYMCCSAGESLYDENNNYYVARVPNKKVGEYEYKAFKMLFDMGSIPDEWIVGEAVYDWKATINSEQKYSHRYIPKTYRFIVY